MYYFFSIAALLLAVTSVAESLSYVDAVYARMKFYSPEYVITIKDSPYHVVIEHENGFMCSGAIIAENWILTVVTCAPDNLAKPMAVVRAGSDQRKSGGSVHQIQDIIKHEEFKANKEGFNKNEIALIRVKEPFALDETRRTIELLKPADKLNKGTKATVTSFLWDEHSDDEKRLRILKKSVVDLKACSKAYEVPEKGYMCADFEEGRRRVLDFGDPLVDQNGRLVGLVYRLNNYEYGSQVLHPVLYTDVSYYYDWIEKRIENYNRVM